MNLYTTNLDESRHYLVYRFIQNLKKLRHLFLDGGSITFKTLYTVVDDY